MSYLHADITTSTLQGEHTYLRELTEHDVTEEYAGWLNDPVVNQYLETRQVTLEGLRSYVQQKSRSAGAILFGIFWKENGKHIGNVKLEPVDRKRKAATLGLLIGNRDYWGKGAGTEATNLATRYAFDVLGMREINLGVIATNAAAIRVYKKCGFRVEKVRKNAKEHNGMKYDAIYMKKCRRSHKPTMSADSGLAHSRVELKKPK